MTVVELLLELHERGIELEVDGDRLRTRGPKGALTDQLRAQLAAHKQDVLKQLRRARPDRALRKPPLVPLPRDGAMPLSFAQQRLWFLDQLEAGWGFNMPMAFRLRGDLDVEALRRSVAAIVDRHEILRTTFLLHDGRPVQHIAPTLTVPLIVEEIADVEEVDQLGVALRRIHEEARGLFDLERGPLLRSKLLRFDPANHVLILTLHHIVTDGWSLAVLMRELTEHYRAFVLGGVPDVPELPVQYADFAAWQRSWLQGERLKELVAQWRSRLPKQLVQLNLPTDRSRPAVQTYEGRQCALNLPESVYSPLRQVGREYEVTPAMVLAAALRVLLLRYTNQDDIVLGSPIANRNRREIEGLIGFFVNILVLRVDCSGDPTFGELLRREREASLAAYDNQDLPFECLVEELEPERNLSRNPLFEVLFAVLNAPKAPLSLPGVVATSVDEGTTTTRFDLEVHVLESRGGLSVRFIYNVDLFDAPTIERMVAHYERLLEAIVAAPDARLSELPLLSDTERRQAVEIWNKTGRSYPSDQCLHEFFESQVDRTPDQLAVVFNGEHLSYRELDARANQLAHALIARGIGAETRVGLFVERSLEMVIGLLGILKAGGAYVPLDPDYPKQRLAFMIEDARTPVLLTQERLLEELPPDHPPALCLDSEWESIARGERGRPSRRALADNLAYVIYTSGSTGRPKGVTTIHRALCNRLMWMQEAYGLEESDRVLQKTPFSFDVSGWEFHWPLLNGAGLVMAEPQGHRDPVYLLELMREQNVTMAHFVPSMLRAFLEVDDLEPARCLKHVFCSGEALPLDLQERFFARLEARLHNLYGPTEAAIDVTSWACRRTDGARSVPIGRPIANTQIYVVDGRFEPVPIGAPGELLIGGIQVARGYHDRPDLTAERFVPDPFARQSGSRLYRTGDLARYGADGTVEFIGRMDHQVKIRGFRIELGEIETSLHDHPDVREAVVVVQEGQSGETGLVAYVVSAGSEEPEPEALRSWLGERLPGYMVPWAYVMMPSLPLTASGKIDRRSLPRPERPESDASHVAPRTSSERMLCEIWSQVLGVEKIGIDDNFFQLGGDSILIIQIVARANRHGLGLSAKQMFQRQTIRELAADVGLRTVVEAEQGEVTGSLPLTPVQHWFFEQQLTKPHHFNQAVLMTLRRPVRVPVLEEAIKHLLSHHDALRLRFMRNEDGKWCQEHAPLDETVPFQVVDLSDLEASQRGEVIEQKASELQASFDLASSPLFRAVLFDLGAGEESRLLIVIHHLVVDGVSWRIVLEDLQRACEQLDEGEAVALPEKTCSFQRWARRLEEYADSEAIGEEEDYWVGRPWERVGQIPVDHGSGQNTGQTEEVVTASLEALETSRLLKDVPQAYNTRINDVLMTALVEALAPWTRHDWLLVNLEGHGREELFEELDVSRTVGWFTTIVPAVVGFEGAAGGGTDPGQALKAIKEQLRDIPVGGIGYGLARHLRSEGAARRRLASLPTAEVSFNYLGQLSGMFGGSSLFGSAPESVGPLQDPRDRRAHVLDVSGAVADGRLRMQWKYSSALHDRATVEAVAERFMSSLRRLLSHCTSPGVGGCTPSDFPLARIGQRELDDLVRAWGREEIEDLYGLSPLQQGIVFLCLREPSSTVYVEQICLKMTDVDEEALVRAWQQVVDRHPVLRTSLARLDADEPVQVVRRHAEVGVSRHDVRSKTQQERVAWLEQHTADERRRLGLTGPAPMRVSLVRTGDREHQCLWTFHHVALDGWSLPLVVGDVLRFYAANRGDEQLELEPVPPYRSYIQWLHEQDSKQAEAYWRELLRGFETPTIVGGKEEAAAGQASDYGQCAFRLSAETTTRLQECARSCGVTLNTLALGAFGLLLSRYSGEEDVVLGTTRSGRPPDLSGVESIVGLFINTLPVRMRVAGSALLETWLRDLQAEQAEQREFEHTPLWQVQQWSEVPGGVPLFENLFVFENYPVDRQARQAAKDRGMRVEHGLSRSGYPLMVEVGVQDRLGGRLTYRQDRISPALAEQLARHYQRLLEAVAATPQTRLSDLSLLDPAERHRILEEWNETDSEYPRDRCLHELIEAQVDRTPGRVAVACGSEEVTYAELNGRANRLAARLRESGAGPETRVAICVERGVAMLVGVLGILKAGGAYVPLDPSHPAARLEMILEDAGARLLLTERSLEQMLPSADQQRVYLDDLDLTGGDDPGNLEPRTWSDHLAYVIYTSGSTGRPKGVQIDHRNVVNFLETMRERPGLTADDVLLAVTTLSFDIAGLELFLPLLVGGRVVIASREEVTDGYRLLQALKDHRVTVMQATPATWQMLLEAGWGGDAKLKMLCGGEALPWSLASELVGRGAELWNMYGPTETTIWSSVSRVQSADGRVTLGRPIANTQLYVLDRHLEPVPVGVPGELYIGGDGVARGYLDRPELTAERFVPDPWGKSGSGRLYRTGDVVRYEPGGELRFLGRVDHQVKLRGYRIELGEIEATLAEHATVQEAVALCREGGSGAKQLVVYVIPAEGEEVAPSALREWLGDRLPSYMVPSAVVTVPSWPLTPNGKIDRRALPRPEQLQGSDSFMAPRTRTEKTLCEIWSEVLEVERIGVHDNFFELGGHSLLATRVASRVRDDFKVELPFIDFFEDPTVAALAMVIDRLWGVRPSADVVPLVRVSREARLPLSFAQQRLWFLDQLGAGSAYNMPMAVRLRGGLDVDLLRQSISAVVDRHEVLRTTFASSDQGPWQRIASSIDLPIPLEDLGGVDEEDRIEAAQRRASEEAQRLFDLARGPLVRARILRLHADDHVLVLTTHHIVSDAWSLGVLMRDMTACYRAFQQGVDPELPELSIQYADFAQWQRNWFQGEELHRQIAYWRERLGDGPPRLEFPTDRPRPAVQTYRAERHRFKLPDSVYESVQATSRRQGVTPAIVLMAAFRVLLSRYTSQDDIVLGSPIANRNRSEIENLVGFFVNSLALRVDLSGDPTFEALLAREGESSIGAYDHQDLPFERLVEELDPERDLSQNPLFQVTFAVQNTPFGKSSFPNVVAESFDIDISTTRFDLEAYLYQLQDSFTISFVFNADLFNASTIERMAVHYQTLLEGAMASPASRLSELPLLGDSELHMLVTESNRTHQPYPERCVHELVTEQAARTPDTVAVEDGHTRLTYAELEARTNRLAHELIDAGAAPEARVGLCMRRSIDMVIGMLGILKTGAAYVPLDPELPLPRLARMLDDASVSLVLTTSDLLERLPGDGRTLKCLDEASLHGAHGLTTPPDRAASIEGLAYVLFTSGSSGTPKGVMIPHRALTNHMLWMARAFPLQHEDCVLQKTPFSFDASVWEFYAPLLSGARLAVAAPDAHRSPEDMIAAIQRHGVTTLQLVPSVLRVLLDDPGVTECKTLRRVFCGGEALSLELAQRCRSRLGASVHNLYGPTEATIDATAYTVDPQLGETRTGTVPIGRPIDNVRAYVLDRCGQPAPVGVPGELYLGGAAIGRGYCDRPDLTAERFVPDTFGMTGQRLYRTGDLVLRRDDGILEFVGRVDHQVKIRGYRIELGEIESTLLQHPAVTDAALALWDAGGESARLVAYVVTDSDSQLIDEQAVVEQEHVEEWKTLYNKLTYDQVDSAVDEVFNTVGWNSSYTGEPLPAEEMEEWVDATVARIRACRPRRVLEIGCGSGLLLHRLAADCERYVGTDFSEMVLGHLGKAVASRNLEQVELLARTADDFRGIQARSVDTVVINSVVQYLPSASYLMRVLEGAVEATVEGGRIFVGDVRNLRLLSAFHTSVELYRSNGTRRLAELERDIRARTDLEPELLLDPDFFHALRAVMPRIGRVQVLLKHGLHHNELTRFRYDVILHINPVKAPVEVERWVDWSEVAGDLKGVRRLLGERPEAIGFARVPNSRIRQVSMFLSSLADDRQSDTVADWNRAMEEKGEGVDPESLRSLAAAEGYATEVNYSLHGDQSMMDAVLWRCHGPIDNLLTVPSFPAPQTPKQPGTAYANDPLRGRLTRKLAPRLREFLSDRLPEYMVPATFIMLDTMPHTPSGKLDRRALPDPNLLRSGLAGDYVAPRNPVEECLVQIWADVLRLERVGIHDNFFELNGHSLLATQVTARARDLLQVEIPVRQIFENPTVAGLARFIESLRWALEGKEETTLDDWEETTV